MKPVHFNPEKDLAPTPFDRRHLLLAEKLKHLGLPFTPHAGCFVWDPQELISAPSPFPDRVYFILSLSRFVGILGSLEEVATCLVWLPTWHQARLLCEERGIGGGRVADLFRRLEPLPPGDELLQLFALLADDLKDKAPAAGA